MKFSSFKLLRGKNNNKYGLNFFLCGIFFIPSTLFISILFLLPAAVKGSFEQKRFFLKDKWNYPFLIFGILILIRINKTGFCASRYGLLGPFHWGWNVGLEKNKKYKKYKKLWDSGNISRSKIGFRNFAKELFPKIPIFVPTSYGGCFAVKKESIRKYDKDFYLKSLEILSKNKNPIEGHYMERLWCYMFTKNNLYLKAINDVLLTKIENYIH